MRTIAIVSNNSWSIYNFWMNLPRTLMDHGYRVMAIAEPDGYEEKLQAEGIQFFPVTYSSLSRNPLENIKLLRAYARALRSGNPDVMVTYTIKPNLLASLASRFLRIPTINVITGMGSIFIRKTWMTTVIQTLYRICLSHSRKVFFLNEEDQAFFLDNHLIPRDVAEQLSGDGIDLERFQIMPGKSPEAPFTFLLLGRMLWDKGVGEYVAAAQILKKTHPEVRCALLGFSNASWITGISREQLMRWNDSGIIEYLGAADDVRPYIGRADCVVLPSYREGMPKGLLEAAAMGKPIIATDIAGCRDIVSHGDNGFLCRARDAADLCDKMHQMLMLKPQERTEMGAQGRRVVECRYDERLRLKRYLSVIDEIIGPEKDTEASVGKERRKDSSFGCEKQKIAIISNDCWSIFNFRLNLIDVLQGNGYEVMVIAYPDGYMGKLTRKGLNVFPVSNNPHGTNPFREFCMFVSYLKIFRRERPALALTFTIKPNLYASLAAAMLHIPTVSNVSGLGSLFINRTWLTQLVEKMYRLAFRKAKTVFFQNDDDMAFFIGTGLVRSRVADRLPGSGIDLSRFHSRTETHNHKVFTFLLYGRMLWDKGIGEYVDAAKCLLKKHDGVCFQLLGFGNLNGPTAISQTQIEAWQKDDLVDYLGSTDDVRPHIAAADCIVLPSYREGLPKSLLEAAAMGKPLIASDVPGCRDVVQNGWNGFLCRAGDAADLAEKMERMLLLPMAQRTQMGEMGQELVTSRYDERLVLQRYLSVTREILDNEACMT